MARYDPKEAEAKWQKFWKDNKLYVFDKASEKPVFSVDTPPPTVSGKMHLGHAFSYAQQDYVARFQRMRGKNVLYPFGSDDNGLPTERLVEKTKKVRHQDFSREEFRKLCLDFVNEEKPSFIQDWVSLGMSCDFKNSYSTIDEHSQRIGQKSFIDLFKKGLLQKKEAPVSWCPTCRTAIAQAEFESVDMKSHFNEIIFKVGAKELLIATTRPELIPACVSLCFHPDDERYQDLKGKFATVPISDHEVPIIADKDVDKDKGTGLMMVCTFGDKEDIEKWHRHNLELRSIFSEDGRVNETVPQYEGLKISDARKKILEDLKKQGVLVSQKDIMHAVNVHERCGTEVEFLKKAQWYISVLEKKKELLDAGDTINWYPKHMKTRYTHWVENLNWDWCVSRQRFYGVPFPVWYKGDEIIVASEDELPIDPLIAKPKDYENENLVPETDVMDTWMISSVSPQIVLDWKEETPHNYPMSLRPQAHDIIRTWAFYTIVKGIFHHKDVPWNDIMISGHVLDPKGRKMGKSKGNAVAPQDVLERFGADALRYWAAGVKLGDDLPYMEKDVQTGQKTVNKIANASRFALMHLEDFSGYAGNLELLDRWLLSKLQRVIKEATDSFEVYEYSKTRFLVDKFFWQNFCDQYLEMVKTRLYDKENFPEARASGQYALEETLGALIKMFAPIMPHITEEIYQQYYAEKEDCKSVHLSSWPEYEEGLIDEEAEAVGDVAVRVVEAVRKFKSQNQISLRESVKKVKVTCDVDLTMIEKDLINVTNAESFEHERGEFNVEIE